MAPEPVDKWLRPVGDRLDTLLSGLLGSEQERWAAIDARFADPVAQLHDFVLAGGKRLRPAFLHWAFVGAGGDPSDERSVTAGAALELLHAFALVHDDVMDATESRRGLPTIHAQGRDRHAKEHWIGGSEHFGAATAILVGDLAHAYADQLFFEAAPDLYDLWHELRVEVNLGQYLDLVAAASCDLSVDTAHRIARYKSGRYTVEHPLRMGAALAGRRDLAASLLEYGERVGTAFQLRDDVLGCFGDPERTGKPVGSDIRERKATLLLALAHERAEPHETEVLDSALRSADPDVDGVLDLIERTGALASVEEEIERLVREAEATLATLQLEPPATEALVMLARFVATRDR